MEAVMQGLQAPASEQLDSNGMIKINDHGGKYFPVALVGIGLRMPGAENLTDFENILVEEKCCIKTIPDHRWHLEDHHHEDSRILGHHSINKLAFCEKLNYFDPEFFDISPREAYAMDPQQTIVLEVAEEAMQDAGYTKETLPKQTGVFIGTGLMDFPGFLTENRFLYSAQTVSGTAHTCHANRISQHYGLTGPSMAVDTACAASLSALHFACISMWSGEIEAAIAGATSYVYSPETTIGFSQLGVLSPTGNSAPFDVTNNGYVRGEGSGVVLLKPLDDAIRDNDHVYCVIRATASSHNGYCNSITLPSAVGQEAVIRKCYSYFGIPMEKVSFVEAHGTGTPVGDPIEATAIGQTLGKSHRGRGPLKIQSAKSNFGHLEVSAGMVQVFKTALMLENRTIYKQINWTEPNPRIDLEALNICIPVKMEQFTEPEKFIVGVNTFGFGGSLVHMVFEEYRPQDKPPVAQAGWKFGNSELRGKKIAIPLSAKSKEAFRNTLNRWLVWEDDKDAQSVVGWLATRREHYSQHRLIVLAHSGADFRAKISGFLAGTSNADVITGSKAPLYQKPAICFVYPDCDQKQVHVGRSLYNNSPVFREAIDECDKIYEKICGHSALKQFGLFINGKNDASNEFLDDRGCRTASLFLQIGLTKLLASWGLKSDIVVGEGLGELAAAFGAGALTMEQTVSMMYLRLKMPSKDDFMKESSRIVNGTKPSTARFYSAVTGDEHNGNLDANFWWRNTVCQQKADAPIRSLLKNDLNVAFVELSPYPCIQDMFDKLDKPQKVLSCCCREEDEWTSTQRVISALHVDGYPVDWSAITEHSARYARIPLYGFNDRFFQLQSQEYKGRRLCLIKRTFRNLNGRIDMNTLRSLRDNNFQGELIFPAGSYMEYFSEYVESKYAGLKDISVHKLLKLIPLTPEGNAPTVKLDMAQKNMRLYAISEEKQTMAVATVAGRNGVGSTPRIDLESAKARCKESKLSEAIYSNFEGRGMSYGRCFKLIQKLYVAELHAVATCKAPYSRTRYERIQGPVLESAFQAAIAAFTVGKTMYLTRTVGQLQMFVEKVPPQTAFSVYVLLKEYSVQCIVCDMTIMAEDGSIWLTIEDYRADNVVSLATDVDYNTCCYQTKWQTNDAVTPSQSELQKIVRAINTRTAVMADEKLDAIRKLITSLAKDAVGKVNNDQAASKLETLSQMEASDETSESVYEHFLDALPEISTEMSHLRNAGEQLVRSADENAVGDMLTTFLRDSVLIRDLLYPYMELTKEMICQSLRHKDTIRVGDFGDISAVFTKNLVQMLEGQLRDGTVEYSYISKDEDRQQGVSEYLYDLVTVKYQLLGSLVECEPATYDIIVVSDVTGDVSNHLAEIEQLLKPGGAVVLLNNGRCHYIYDYLSLQNAPSVLITSKHLSDAGFDDVIDLSYSMSPAYTVLIGQKPTVSRECNGKTFAVVHKDMPALAQRICDRLKGKANIYTISEFVDEPSKGWRAVSVLYLMGNQQTDDETGLNISELLDAKPEGSVASLYVIYDSYQGQADLPGFVEMIRSRSASSAYPVYTVGVQDCENELSAIVNTVTQGSHSEREMMIVNGQVLVPRIRNLNTDCLRNNDKSWQLDFVTTDQQTAARFSALSLSVAKNEVKIRIMGIAVSEKSPDAVFAYSGIIEENGADRSDYKLGEAVMGLGRMPLRSHLVCDVNMVHAMPSELSWAEAADSLLSYTTAYTALVDQAMVKPGQTLLVDTTNPSLAQAAGKLARLKGLKVIYMVSGNQDNEHLPRGMGVLTVANPAHAGFKADIMNLTDNKGVDVVLQMGKEGLPHACVEVLASSVHICKVGAKLTANSRIPNARYSALHLSSLVKRSSTKVQETVALVASLLDRDLLAPVKVPSRQFGGDLCHLKPSSLDESPSGSVVLEIPGNYRPPMVHSMQIRFRSEASYVVVTGNRLELALEVCRWMANNGARHIGLVSLEGKNSFLSKATEKYLNSKKARFYSIASDMATKQQVENAIAKIATESRQPIKGVFHVNDDEMDDITGETGDKMMRALQYHVRSVRYLADATSSVNLDYFVVFSSADDIWGNRELPVRAAVARVSTELCERISCPGRRVLCVKLGHIRGLGSPSEVDRLVELAEKVGSKSLHVDEYLAILGTLLQLDNLPGSVAITYQDWDKTRKLVESNSMKFQHLCKDNGLSNDAEDSDINEERIQKCKLFISALLGANPDDIDPNHPMTEYGVDSLMSTDIISWAQKTHKITVEQSEIFGGLSINQLLAKI